MLYNFKYIKLTAVVFCLFLFQKFNLPSFIKRHFFRSGRDILMVNYLGIDQINKIKLEEGKESRKEGGGGEQIKINIYFQV